MAKRILSASESSELRSALHVAVLHALVSSRRWEPGDLIFQGGTSLHLVHGSPRFSEDLNFLVKSSLNLDPIGASIQARLGKSSGIPSDAKLLVTKAKDGDNPHAFDVCIGGPSIIGSVRVKVELWQAPARAMESLSVVVALVRVTSGPTAGAQAFIPAARPREIYADKVFALAARACLKPRDVFDLHWLREHKQDLHCAARDLAIRLETYPNESPVAWIEKARARKEALPLSAESIQRDLARWLPSSWRISPEAVQEMIDASVLALQDGIVQMELLQQDESAEDAERWRGRVALS
ncbi:MAG: nucleotidyl transferase AbiEii/AbiGii toxin family protein [Betaproteobacteria bacterium]